MLDSTPGASFSIFTDSQAAMMRLRTDGPGLGQGRAVRGVQLAREVIRCGATVSIRWVPGHAAVQGNEVADMWASEAAVREEKARASKERGSRPIGISRSLTFLKTALEKKAVAEWRQEIIARCQGRRAFRIPRVGEVPRIPPGPQGTGVSVLPLRVWTRYDCPFPKGEVWVDRLKLLLMVRGRQTKQRTLVQRVQDVEGRD